MNQLPRGGRYLLIASTGGHLTQLDIVARLLEADSTSHWVTFENHQSRSMLSTRPHTFVEYIGPRQLGRAVRSVPQISHLLRMQSWDAVISTGAALAVPGLLLAAMNGTPAYYIESVSRIDGPSLTGKLLAPVPGIQMFTQHKSWSSARWEYDISVFDSFSATSSVEQPALTKTKTPSSIFITLGTIRPYRFDALIDALLDAKGIEAADITWQVGVTHRRDLPGSVYAEMDQAKFRETSMSAGIVVTHAGVATCLQLVASGIHPIVVPRRSSRHEHVDDHQEQIARELARRDLCTYVEVENVPEIIGTLLNPLNSSRP